MAPENSENSNDGCSGEDSSSPARRFLSRDDVELEALGKDAAGVPPAIDDVLGDDRASRLKETVCGTVAGVETTVEPPEPELKPGRILADRYRIVGEIARGGMGVVLKAWDTRIGRFCALKVLHKHHANNLGLRLRFEREARLNGLMEHPGIVPMHEIYLSHPEFAFFSMRFIEGRTLYALLQDRTDPEQGVPQYLGIFHRVCETIAYAHSRQVVHRDIKTQNIMVGAYGVVKVMDWGLAKLLNGDHIPPADFELWDAEDPEPGNLGAGQPHTDQPATQHGLICGTLSYAPPEQVRGDHAHVTERSDVFTLGGVLCEILTGLPTYTAKNLSSLYKASASANVRDAVARLERCTAERALVHVALQCLEPDPANRMADAGEVSDAIAAYITSDQRRAERDQVRFFDLSLDLFCIAGLDGYFRRVNVNFERVLGYSQKEITSRPFHEFIFPDDLKSTARAVQMLQEGHPVVRFINRYRHKKGHLVTLEWASRSVPQEGVIYAVAREITASSAVSGWSLAIPRREAAEHSPQQERPGGGPGA